MTTLSVRCPTNGNHWRTEKFRDDWIRYFIRHAGRLEPSLQSEQQFLAPKKVTVLDTLVGRVELAIDVLRTTAPLILLR